MKQQRISKPQAATDLPVMHEFALRSVHRSEFFSFMPESKVVGVAILTILATWLTLDSAWAQMIGDQEQTVLQTLIKWTPLIFFGAPGEFGGFTLNVGISFLAMAIGTLLGLSLGVLQLSRNIATRNLSRLLTQIFRNSPWLVLLFYAMLLIPFKVEFLGIEFGIAGWLKATIALSLPIMANVADIVRGAVGSIPTGQWESAESLAFTRHQTIWHIILPQCVKRMIPPWMNWYCILAMSTPLVSILGVNDAMTLTRDALAAEGRSEFLIPLYLWLMSWFFIYTYPIALYTRRLEARFAVR